MIEEEEEYQYVETQDDMGRISFRATHRPTKSESFKTTDDLLDNKIFNDQEMIQTNLEVP